MIYCKDTTRAASKSHSYDHATRHSPQFTIFLSSITTPYALQRLLLSLELYLSLCNTCTKYHLFSTFLSEALAPSVKLSCLALPRTLTLPSSVLIGLCLPLGSTIPQLALDIHYVYLIVYNPLPSGLYRCLFINDLFRFFVLFYMHPPCIKCSLMFISKSFPYCVHAFFLSRSVTRICVCIDFTRII
jgi:hypothetical protein